ncbi:glycosyltransferase [Glycomyces buryatensis]|uniref:Glycosyltransferase family 1 protein n=1 Tax=Glycomyces buryatensis TaxID=2570927 RepID=A0A4S8QLS0_9ACTN|nr:glycosyltransferase [Glycomyces buryatensis]THV41684.1 glycosyltransferase family 1 protein [Glycomyces buryatensis]
MRVLITTYGSRGDVEPVAGLARQLRELGVQVRVCAPPDEEFARLLTAVGAETVPVGRSVRDLVAGPKRATPADAPQLAAMLVNSQFEALLPAAQGCDALVATGLFPAAARTVAEHYGIPYVFVSFLPGVLPSPHHPPLPRPGKPYPPGADNASLWDIDAENLTALYRTPLNEVRASIDLPAVDDVRGHTLTDRPWLASDPVLGPWPETPELEVVRTGTWILPDERPLAADLEAFLDAGEAPVFVGFGSMPIREPAEASRVVIESVRAQGRRAILAKGWVDMALTDAQDDCFSVGEVNHQTLFPRVAAVVHHGGAGTTATASRSGVPQVVVPQMADQPYWAERVTDLGIGVAHDGPIPTVESLSAALRTALDSRTVERAGEVAADLRTDGAAVAARLLVEMARPD